MQARLHEIKATAFLPDRGPVDTKASCGAAMALFGTGAVVAGVLTVLYENVLKLVAKIHARRK